MNQTCEEICNILNNPERENIKIEFKKSDLLRDHDGQKEIGYSIAALANRYGGKLILGINNDGTFEGKEIFDIDRDKGIIESICHTKISPIIDYSTEFLQCDNGDVLIINIPRRKGTPHAYIVSRDGPEIKNRIYYIRTSHGKSLVTDLQLEWLFKHQEDPDFVFPFRIIINYFKDSFGIPGPIQQPNCIRNYVGLVNSIPEEDIGTLTKDWETMQSFFIEITPYALIHSFSWLFTHSWLIDVYRVEGKTNLRPSPQRVSLKKISIGDIPKTQSNSMIASLSWDFQKILESIGFLDFYVPSDTELQVQYDNEGKQSQLSLKSNDFNFNITFRFSSMGAGLHFTHPIRAVLMNRKPIEGQEKMHDLCQFIEMDCVFKASFNFPDEHVELFNEYYRYANTIKNHLENDWNYDHFIEGLPHNKLYVIDNKLNDILKILKEKL